LASAHLWLLSVEAKLEEAEEPQVPAEFELILPEATSSARS
jgi:hypothetical protein